MMQSTPAMPQPIPYTPQCEFVPADEEEDIQRVLKAMLEILARDAKSSGALRRDVHVKSHGSPVAKFYVLSGLPAELRQGLFTEERIQPAVVRFSSSSPRPVPDIFPDARGVAIQVPAAGSHKRQDFLMANQPAFIARDVKDYLRIQRARLNSYDAIRLLTEGNWDPRHWNWRGLGTVKDVLLQSPIHPASQTYYSMAPIRYGDYIAKYRLRLLSPSPPSFTKFVHDLATQKDACRLALSKSLSSASLTFEFQVQLLTNPVTMPIEDATVVWPEEESPFQTVAHLVLPRQELDASPFGNGDSLSFNVWNALEEHRPLGGINRVRKFAYEVSAAWRNAASV